MSASEKNEQKLLYAGTSLEEFLTIKNKLQNKGIAFTEKQTRHDSWFRFLTLLFIGTGSYGMHGERVTDYSIYVKKDDYVTARNVTGIEDK